MRSTLTFVSLTMIVALDMWQSIMSSSPFSFSCGRIRNPFELALVTSEFSRHGC